MNGNWIYLWRLLDLKYIERQSQSSTIPPVPHLSLGLIDSVQRKCQFVPIKCAANESFAIAYILDSSYWHRSIDGTLAIDTLYYIRSANSNTNSNRISLWLSNNCHIATASKWYVIMRSISSTVKSSQRVREQNRSKDRRTLNDLLSSTHREWISECVEQQNNVRTERISESTEINI